MLDTGSPISFVHPRVYKQLFDTPLDRLEIAKQSYMALNNTLISLYGSIQTSIRLEQFPDVNANITLHVFWENFDLPDMIVGRDFIISQNYAILYDPAFKHDLAESDIERSKALLFSHLTDSEESVIWMRHCEVSQLISMLKQKSN